MLSSSFGQPSNSYASSSGLLADLIEAAPVGTSASSNALAVAEHEVVEDAVSMAAEEGLGLDEQEERDVLIVWDASPDSWTGWVPSDAPAVVDALENAARFLVSIRSLVIRCYDDPLAPSACPASFRTALEASGVLFEDCSPRAERSDVTDHLITAEIALFSSVSSAIIIVTGRHDFVDLLQRMAERGTMIVVAATSFDEANRVQPFSRAVLNWPEMLRGACSAPPDPASPIQSTSPSQLPSPQLSSAQLPSPPHSTTSAQSASYDELDESEFGDGPDIARDDGADARALRQAAYARLHILLRTLPDERHPITQIHAKLRESNGLQVPAGFPTWNQFFIQAADDGIIFRGKYRRREKGSDHWVALPASARQSSSSSSSAPRPTSSGTQSPAPPSTRPPSTGPSSSRSSPPQLSNSSSRALDTFVDILRGLRHQRHSQRFIVDYLHAHHHELYRSAGLVSWADFIRLAHEEGLISRGRRKPEVAGVELLWPSLPEYENVFRSDAMHLEDDCDSLPLPVDDPALRLSSKTVRPTKPRTIEATAFDPLVATLRNEFDAESWWEQGNVIERLKLAYPQAYRLVDLPRQARVSEYIQAAVAHGVVELDNSSSTHRIRLPSPRGRAAESERTGNLRPSSLSSQRPVVSAQIWDRRAFAPLVEILEELPCDPPPTQGLVLQRMAVAHPDAYARIGLGKSADAAQVGAAYIRSAVASGVIAIEKVHTIGGMDRIRLLGDISGPRPSWSARVDDSETWFQVQPPLPPPPPPAPATAALRRPSAWSGEPSFALRSSNTPHPAPVATASTRLDYSAAVRTTPLDFDDWSAVRPALLARDPPPAAAPSPEEEDEYGGWA